MLKSFDPSSLASPRPPNMKACPMTQPLALEGVTILDLSRVLAGPWSTQILADLGAKVIKVEKPDRGDDTRIWGPPFIPGTTDAAYFACTNRNKHSVAVDFAREEGAAIIREMAKKADILVENFKLGGLAKYGLDYESLKSENPGLIYCSITGFGQTGPYAPRAGYDYLIQGMSGLMSVTGHDTPTKVGVAISDLVTGLYATISILAALRHREQTGQGQHIDCSLLDCQTAAMANQAANWLVGGVVPKAMGNNHPNVVPYRVFAVADGHIIIACGNDGQFQRLCQALGMKDEATDPRFVKNVDRVLNRQAIDDLIEARTKQLSKQQALELLEKHAVPGGPINNIPEVFEDPHIQARGLLNTLTREDGTNITAPGFPVKLSETPARSEIAPPTLGVHTNQVLEDMLSLQEKELEALRSKGIIG